MQKDICIRRDNKLLVHFSKDEKLLFAFVEIDNLLEEGGLCRWCDLKKSVSG